MREATMARKTVVKAETVVAKEFIEQPRAVMTQVSALNPAPYNPRKINPKMFAALKANILRFGFLQPLVVQERGKVIIGGHQRLKALKEICVEHEKPVPKVPCVFVDVTDTEAKRLNLALNRIEGEFDARLLGELFVELRARDTTLEQFSEIGFEPEDVTKYIHVVEPPEKAFDDEELGTFGRSLTLSLEFTDMRVRDAVKKLLKERTETAKKKSGDLVADALGLRHEAAAE
jgi:ParB-like chromosome segregation protein Spo0J